MTIERRPRRAVIVNAYIDGLGRRGDAYGVPQSLAPAMLAGALDPTRWTIRLYNEHASGPLRDAHLLAELDLLVLTGLTSAMDHMLQLTAYAKTLNPSVVVVAGGPAIRAMPNFSRRVFDYACLGDVEELRDVVRDAFGDPTPTDGDIVPRYDLAPWLGGRFGYVEATRNCNFRCSFCSIAGEGRRYQSIPIPALKRQIAALANPRHLIFLDNNFYGSDRSQFHARLALLSELRERGVCSTWSGLVTQDFFTKADNLAAARRSGCAFLFSGVESFNERALIGFNKRQNNGPRQVDTIANCFEAGIAFFYGIVFDPSSRSIVDMRSEIEFILETPSIPLPTYFSFAAPLPGTPFFADAVRRRLIRPNVLLRDLHGQATVLHSPHDTDHDVDRFEEEVLFFRGYGRRGMEHSIALARRYRRYLSPMGLIAATAPLALLCKPGTRTWNRRASARATSERRQAPRANATPFMRVSPQFESYFTSTAITDAFGNLSAALALDFETLTTTTESTDPAAPR